TAAHRHSLRPVLRPQPHRLDDELAVPYLDRGPLAAGDATLSVQAPALGRGERGAEGVGGDARREADAASRAVVLEAAQRQEDAVRRHRPRVVLAALDLVERVALARGVPVVRGAGDDEPLLHQTVVDHLRGRLVLLSRP